MGIGFTQNAVITVNAPIPEAFSERFMTRYYQDCGGKYRCITTAEGYVLQPQYAFGLRNESLAPEITVTVATVGERTTLTLTGRLRQTVRLFLTVYWVFCGLMEAGMLGCVAAFGPMWLGSPWPLLIPLALSIYAYGLSRFVTKATFTRVVRIIQTAFSDRKR